ncbi:MAG: tRNA 2-thiouridine(34) synthase MnmA [Bdellovibrionales bacterium]|nr:tRNA 2-thiouridine(34) synthase MnmA [Bdellovibrionales bacterium]
MNAPLTSSNQVTSDQVAGKVVIAMSGGVDSSVAAYILHRDNIPTVGVSMQVWDYRNNGGCADRVTCCAPSDFADARSVATRIGIPYYVFDFEKEFHEKVINKFVAMYGAGETPNPCVDCNNDVKFRELRKRALSLGCRAVATGHYAKITQSPLGYHLYRAKDDHKDQSYFLYGLRQEELSHTLFPLADLTKSEVREIAREAGLATAEKAESQDICFVGSKVDEFVGKRLGAKVRPGYLKSPDGKILGRHDGIHRFTLGQRRGVGISGSDVPLYVVDIDPESATVYIGPRNSLEREGFSVGDINWISPTMLQRMKSLSAEDPEEMSQKSKSDSTFQFEAIVQVRHKHRGVKALVTVHRDASARVKFVSEWTTPAPGQAAVFFDPENQEVLGGGRILRETRASLQILPPETISRSDSESRCSPRTEASDRR